MPEKKHTEALNFYKKEILDFIKEKINQTPQSLCKTTWLIDGLIIFNIWVAGEGKATDASNEKYERVVSAAVMMLGHLIGTIKHFITVM